MGRERVRTTTRSRPTVLLSVFCTTLQASRYAVMQSWLLPTHRTSCRSWPDYPHRVYRAPDPWVWSGKPWPQWITHSTRLTTLSKIVTTGLGWAF